MIDRRIRPHPAPISVSGNVSYIVKSSVITHSFCRLKPTLDDRASQQKQGASYSIFEKYRRRHGHYPRTTVMGWSRSRNDVTKRKGRSDETIYSSVHASFPTNKESWRYRLATDWLRVHKVTYVEETGENVGVKLPISKYLTSLAYCNQQASQSFGSWVEESN